MKNKVAINIRLALLSWMCFMIAIVALCVKNNFTCAELSAEASCVWHKTSDSVRTTVSELYCSLDSLADSLMNIYDTIFNFIYFDYCDFILNLF